MAADGTLEAAQDVLMSERIAQIAAMEKQALLDSMGPAVDPRRADAVRARARGERRRKAKVSNASRLKNRKR